MKYPLWSFPSKKAFLLEKTVHIWKIQFSNYSGEEHSLLNALNSDEKKRAAKFYFEIDRNRYVVTRAFLKILIAKMLSTDPLNINFSYNEHGKPHLKNKDDLYFNISHSADLGLIAITDIAPVGIDVEQYRERINIEKIAKRFFSEKEVTALLNIANDNRLQGFFDCWTRKEALIKALGLGLSMPLKDFTVNLQPGTPARLLEINHKDEKTSHWTINNIPIKNSYSAAFAIKSKSFTNHYWHVEQLF